MDKLVYVTITMKKGFLKIMDKYAKKHFMKRSEFIRNAVVEYILAEESEKKDGDNA